ncbi:MAG: Rpn family recombination-promoting nuclease/putative transposase [Thermoguttaceae bacterium]
MPDRITDKPTDLAPLSVPPSHAQSTPQPLTRKNFLEGLAFDISHDDFFKQTFALQGIAIAFLKIVLDLALLKTLDLQKLMVEEAAYLDLKFNDFYADKVYRIPFLDGGELYIRVIIEHKSQNDFGTIAQLTNYVIQSHVNEMSKIDKWKKDTRLPPVIAIILHQGNTAFRGKTEFSDVIHKQEGVDEYQVKMRAILFDLSKITIENLPHDPDCPEFWPIMMIMKTVFRKRDLLENFDEILQELQPYLDDPGYLYLTRLAVHYVASSNARELEDADIVQMEQTIQKTVGGDMTVTFTNSFYQQGIALGRSEGVALGEARGVAIAEPTWRARERAERVAEALDLRFDKVPYQLTEQILMMTDLDKLEKLFRLACKCTSLEDFEAVLNQ